MRRRPFAPHDVNAEFRMIARAAAERHARLPRSRMDIDAMVANAGEASAFLKALAHEGRLVILCLLTDGEKSVIEIEQGLDLRQPAVSQQLARLRADNLVESRRDGKNIYYSPARADVRDVIQALHRSFCKR